jgi:hypothetical protein
MPKHSAQTSVVNHGNRGRVKSALTGTNMVSGDFQQVEDG